MKVIAKETNEKDYIPEVGEVFRTISNSNILMRISNNNYIDEYIFCINIRTGENNTFSVRNRFLPVSGAFVEGYDGK